MYMRVLKDLRVFDIFFLIIFDSFKNMVTMDISQVSLCLVTGRLPNK